MRTVQRSALCRSRRELSNEDLLAKFGFDTAENEPCEVRTFELSEMLNLNFEISKLFFATQEAFPLKSRMKITPQAERRRAYSRASKEIGACVRAES